VRLLRSGLSRKDIEGKIKEIVAALFRNIPSGVGSHRKDFKLSPRDQDKVLTLGACWAVKEGFGSEEDLERIEEGGCIEGARPDWVSAKALERGKDQLGTLGSGNHFIEVGYVETVYDPATAEGFGLFQDQVTVMVHTGSRGLGHQICDEAVRKLIPVTAKYGIELPDRQLCCAPLSSPEGKEYLAVMAAAANFAFANRQIITHWVQETLERVLHVGPKDLGLTLVYDLCHNIAKFEDHEWEGRKRRLCVHRKGATRAFGPHHPQIPAVYRKYGQPVLIPGDMGRYSYVLVGTERAMRETFGSACHGAGRVMSRQAAIKAARGRSVVREMEERGIIVQGAGKGTIVEEISEAYKDVAKVVEVIHQADIARKVARLKPLGVIKG
jgi:tRNA-splicing ligase RtcB